MIWESWSPFELILSSMDHRSWLRRHFNFDHGAHKLKMRPWRPLISPQDFTAKPIGITRNLHDTYAIKRLMTLRLITKRMKWIPSLKALRKPTRRATDMISPWPFLRWTRTMSPTDSTTFSEAQISHRSRKIFSIGFYMTVLRHSSCRLRKAMAGLRFTWLTGRLLAIFWMQRMHQSRTQRWAWLLGRLSFVFVSVPFQSWDGKLHFPNIVTWLSNINVNSILIALRRQRW